jgi:hypothetical protein
LDLVFRFKGLGFTTLNWGHRAPLSKSDFNS